MLTHTHLKRDAEMDGLTEGHANECSDLYIGACMWPETKTDQHADRHFCVFTCARDTQTDRLTDGYTNRRIQGFVYVRDASEPNAFEYDAHEGGHTDGHICMRTNAST